MKATTIRKACLALCLTALTTIQAGGQTRQKAEGSSWKTEYEYAKDVMQLTEEHLGYIIGTEKEYLTYRADTPKELLPRKDQIVTCGINRIFPSGINDRVTRVQVMKSGNIRCYTEPASLEETFEHLNVSGTFSLIPEDQDFIWAKDAEGNDIKIEVVRNKE